MQTGLGAWKYRCVGAWVCGRWLGPCNDAALAVSYETRLLIFFFFLRDLHVRVLYSYKGMRSSTNLSNLFGWEARTRARIRGTATRSNSGRTIQRVYQMFLSFHPPLCCQPWWSNDGWTSPCATDFVFRFHVPCKWASQHARSISGI